MNLWKPSIVLALFFVAGCAGNPIAPDTPNWLSTLIHQFESEPASNSPGLVAQYAYKGQSVYFVPQRCCDVMSVAYSTDGAVICHPDGGLNGKGDEMCADFVAERRNEKIVWRDSRK
jgi:hypothetical protein